MPGHDFPGLAAIRRTLRRCVTAAAVFVAALGFALPACAGEVGLAWDASTDVSVTGYYVYYGSTSHSYGSKIDAGNQTAYTVPALTNGQTYYLAVTAYNAFRVESAYSNEVSTTVAASTPAQTGITSSANPVVFGTSVTFTATVSGTTPTGNVTFKDGGTTIAGCSAAALVGSGNIRTATCAAATLPVGTHSVVATYNGDANNGGSTSSALSEVVTSLASGTTVASSLNPSNVGNSVTFTATVTGTAPTGNVNFTDGGTSISGCSAVALTGSGNSRIAVCATTALAVGSHSVVAAYGGGGGNAASSSGPLSQVVNKVATTTTVASSVNPANAGASVKFTATVVGNAPTGNVNFTDGGTSISGCSAVALTGSGNSRTATCTTSSLAAGTRSIVAAYGGNVNNATSTSNSLSQLVKANATVSMASSANPSPTGLSVTLTATVTGIAPTGTVNFKDGNQSISGCSSSALTGSGNSRTAACTTSSFSIGTHSVTAAYGGDAGNMAKTSSALSQVVTSKVATTTSVASSANPSPIGSSVTLTATVTGAAPTGTVNFKDGSTSISGCSAAAVTGSGNSRTATCATPGLTAGTHSITAAYGGNASNLGSTSSALSQVVATKAATTTTLVSSLNPSPLGTLVTLTATVAGSAPTGSVNFTDGGNSIAGCSMAMVEGTGNSRTAVCNTTTLAFGSHSIVAAYVGDIGNYGSSSTPLTQTVDATATGDAMLQIASSRKVHGAAGTFDLPLSLVAINPTTEPRQGPTATVVFTFNKAIQSATVAVTEGSATAGVPTFVGNDVVVGLTGVADQQYVRISLINVHSVDGFSGGIGTVRMGFLQGDVSQNGVITLADVAMVSGQLTQTVTAANFLSDVNLSGTISNSDKGMANAKQSHALPAP